MKKLVIAVVLVLVIAGAAVGVLFWFKIGPFAPEPAADAGAAAGKPGIALGPPPEFVDVPPLLVPVFQGDTVAGTVNIQITLEAVNEDNAVKIAHLMPRLSDAYLRALYTLIPQLLKTEKRLEVETVKRRLMAVGDKVAGPGVITNVLIQSMTDDQAP